MKSWKLFRSNNDCVPQGSACIVGLTAQHYAMSVVEARFRMLPTSTGQDSVGGDDTARYAMLPTSTGQDTTQESAQVSEERRVPGAQATEVQ
jgi:hypothetical protein